MNGKRAKALRREAEELTISKSKAETKAMYKLLKSNHLSESRYPRVQHYKAPQRFPQGHPPSKSFKEMRYDMVKQKIFG